MAEFTLSLLTPTSLDKASSFIKATFGRYEGQKKISGDVCYTFNEKLSIHQNAQKELSFSMDRMILNHDERYVNPYIAAIHVGSLIELKDKYNNCYLFIVKQIAYNFKEYNIVYNYTCQDAFSYQHTRQQSGYTIQNDASSDTFIGPKTIDWWVREKIVPECYINYNYCDLHIGLYEDTNGYIQEFTEEDRLAGLLSSVKRIIKEPFYSKAFNDSGEEYDEYDTTITFACSGSNANAALISLGDNLDLMIHTYESGHAGGVNDGLITYSKYFWFEPKQNQDVTGLAYSPKDSISNFGLTFAGDSLTTILNVNSHSVGDELITLLPSVPAFFMNLFMGAEWENQDIKYYPGYFTDLINGKKIGTKDGDIKYDNASLISDDNIGNWLAIPVYDNATNKTLTLPLLYDHFGADWNNKFFTRFNIIDSATVFEYSSRKNALYLIIFEEQNSTITYKDIIKDGEEIPSQYLNKDIKCYLAIPYNTTSSEIIIDQVEICLNFYRNFTVEEKEFAEVADAAPWLENRLIDFSYFLKQKIITPHEYQSILDKLQNDLRIVNGKLLYYTETYYNALKTKVKMINLITTTLDHFGAKFEANVVSPAAEGGMPTNIAEVATDYNNALTLTTATDSTPYLLNYNEVLNSYFDKYMSAEQRFLKNIYAFRNYFNSGCSISFTDGACIYENTIKAPSSIDDYFISLENLRFKTWDGESNGLLFYVDNGKYYDAKLINEINYANYYKPLINSGTLVSLSDSSLKDYEFDYNAHNKYYLTESNYDSYFNKSDYDDIRRKDVKKINVNGTVYCELNTNELKRLILHKMITKSYNPESDNPWRNKLYFKDTTTYVPFDWVRLDWNQVCAQISWVSLPNFLDYWDQDKANGEYEDIKTWNEITWRYYKSFFPVNTIYYKGPVITYKVTTEKGSDNKDKEHYYFYRLNSLGQSVDDILRTYIKDTKSDVNNINEYINNLTSIEKNKLLLKCITDDNNPNTYEAYQAIPFITNGSLLQDWGPCANDEAKTEKDSINAAWNYYAFKYKVRAVKDRKTTFKGSRGENSCQWLKKTAAFRAFEGHFSNNIWHTKNNSHNAKGWGKQTNVKGYGVFAELPVLQSWSNDYQKQGYKWDSFFANYARTPEAGDDYQKLVALWCKGSTRVHKPGWISAYQSALLTNITVDFESHMGDSLEAYQYFNFYKFIAASYSFRRRVKPNGTTASNPYFNINGNTGGSTGTAGDYDNHLYIKNKYLRVLTKNDLINNKDSYIRIPIYEDESSSTIATTLEQVPLQDRNQFLYIYLDTNGNIGFKDSKNRFSSITWYPLYNLGVDIDFKSMDIWNNSKTITLENAVNSDLGTGTNINISIEDNGIVTYINENTDDLSCGKYIYCHIEEYEKEMIIDINQLGSSLQNKNSLRFIDPTQYRWDPLRSKQAPSTVYWTTNDTVFDVLKEKNVLRHLSDILYVITDKDAAFTPVTSEDFESSKLKNNIYYYSKEDNGYERVYTANQVKAALAETPDETYCSTETALKFRMLDGSSTTITTFNSTTVKFSSTLYLSHIEKNSNGIYDISCKKYDGYELNFESVQGQAYKVCNNVSISYEGQTYKNNFTLYGSQVASLKGLSNGTFWYIYHEKSEWTMLFELAAAIETQLQTYWQQAYNASKYCKYFLPENWRPGTNTIKNAFAKKILQPKYDTDGQLLNVELLNYFVPEVEIYSNEDYDKTMFNKHYLPKYVWYLDPDNTPDAKSIAKKGLDYKNYVSAESITILNDLFGGETPINDLMKTLNTKLSDWYVIENGLTVYYYNSVESSGMLWANLANEFGGQSIFDLYQGLYGMAWHILRSSFKNRDVSEYTRLKEEHDKIWNQFYQDYPFLMLEDNYSYTNATNSHELLKMAKLIFKAKREPEKNYNIALIDSISLQGYIGQELKPGQGILINAKEYYNENDDIAAALKQYLFITDISYSLRNDSSISITVNSIKYQEKLLQSLVKLIR